MASEMNTLAGAGVDTDDEWALRALLIRTEAAADELAAASAQHSDQVAAAPRRPLGEGSAPAYLESGMQGRTDSAWVST